MDLLELLRKRGVDGDVDFLREALRVLKVISYGGSREARTTSSLRRLLRMRETQHQGVTRIPDRLPGMTRRDH